METRIIKRADIVAAMTKDDEKNFQIGDYITDRQHEYCREAEQKLRKLGYRVTTDARSESMGAKIKDARNMRIPVMAVVGDQELANGTFAIRTRREGQLGEMDFETFAKKLQSELDNRF